MKTLKFTTTAPGPLGSVAGPSRYIPKKEEITLDMDASKNMRIKTAYIHGKAEDTARYDIPVFFGGDLRQMEEPLEKQDIKMYIEEEIFEMKAILCTEGFSDYYLLMFKDEKDE